MVCLDTNVIIDLLGGEKLIHDLLKSYGDAEQMSITAITEYELLKPNNKIGIDKTTKLLENFTIYEFNENAAIKSASIFRELKGKGKMINENDILIAGIALANKEILITRDKKFEHLGIDSIKIV